MTEVEQQGRLLVQARDRERRAMAALGAVVRTAAEQGETETELAKQAGVNRATVRKMLGKG